MISKKKIRIIIEWADIILHKYRFFYTKFIKNGSEIK